MVVSVFTSLRGDSEIRCLPWPYALLVGLCLDLPDASLHPSPPWEASPPLWPPRLGAVWHVPCSLEFQWRLHLVKSPSWSRLMLLASIFILSDVVLPPCACVCAW